MERPYPITVFVNNEDIGLGRTVILIRAKPDVALYIGIGDSDNAGNSTNERFFDDLMDFVDKMREEEMRAAREGLTDEELEIFDLLKKENLTKDEEQKVKLAAKGLLYRLREGQPTVLITGWDKTHKPELWCKLQLKRFWTKNGRKATIGLFTAQNVIWSLIIF